LTSKLSLICFAVFAMCVARIQQALYMFITIFITVYYCVYSGSELYRDCDSIVSATMNKLHMA